MWVIVKKTGQALYRIWFYILVTIPIIIFFPLLLISSISEKTYPQFFWLARNLWAPVILYGMGCPPQVRYAQRMESKESYMLVANHTSMLDIMLMLRVSRNPFVFVGKKELGNLPIFGFFYKRVCILVDREDSRSRSAVYRRAQARLAKGLSICIFPEGGVPEESVILDTFKDGAFKMAITHNIKVVPMTFYDNKQRFPFRFFSGSPGPLRTRVHPFFDTKAYSSSEATSLRTEVWNLIYESLQKGPQGQV